MNGPAVRITGHALDKLREEKERGFDVDEDLAIEIALRPYQVVPARHGRIFAQTPIDEQHFLRVLFEEEADGLVIITVYVGARRQYEI